MSKFRLAPVLLTKQIKQQPKQQQQGWIMLEVILCLALFAVVLHVSQRQSEAQWQSLQQVEAQGKQQENEQKQAAMMQLVGSVAWITQQPDISTQVYPDCQKCTGSQLEQWFYASQQTGEGER